MFPRAMSLGMENSLARQDFFIINKNTLVGLSIVGHLRKLFYRRHYSIYLPVGKLREYWQRKNSRLMSKGAGELFRRMPISGIGWQKRQRRRVINYCCNTSGFEMSSQLVSQLVTHNVKVPNRYRIFSDHWSFYAVHIG